MISPSLRSRLPESARIAMYPAASSVPSALRTIGGKTGFVRSGIMIPTVNVLRVRNPDARVLRL
jgi:hypothetical protein